jgi:protein tyrosine/serine phosphatase/predicted nucleotidyltransferase
MQHAKAQGLASIDPFLLGIHTFVKDVVGVSAAVLFGSYARKEATPASDIDIQLLVEESFSPAVFRSKLEERFGAEIQKILEIRLRDKLVVYRNDKPKVEFQICRRLSEINRNFLGSAISDLSEVILFEREPGKSRLGEYLRSISEVSLSRPSDLDNIWDLVHKFQYEFENCSSFHRRSDGYRFYYFYNIALHIAIQLDQLAKGNSQFNFLPRYILAKGLADDQQNQYYQLNGSLFLPDANRKKRSLLDFLYGSLEKLLEAPEFEEVKAFCESVYERDFFWNFRDVSKFNNLIKPGILFRTATLSLFQKEGQFKELLKKNQIRAIIDLRADREVEELPYDNQTIAGLKYIRTPWDPWDQPLWFKERYGNGDNEEVAYRFFMLCCKSQIREAIESILEIKDGAVALHCFAGKDRTGIFTSLLHLLVDAPTEVIQHDYLASEYQMNGKRLEEVLETIRQSGGIWEYFISCGLSEFQIKSLKNRLLYGCS